MTRRIDERTQGDAAARAWQTMSALVLDQDRRTAVADALDLSFARVRALRRLVAEPRTLRELAGLLGADPPYVTLIVDDLERRELVQRLPHPTDRRAKLVHLTGAGRAAAAKAEAILDTPPPALQALPAADVEALARILALIDEAPAE